MKNNEVIDNQIAIYENKDGLRLEVQVFNDTVWLTQAQIAEVFGKDRTVITKHIRNIFKEGELDEAVCAKFAHTASDDKVYDTNYYNLDMVISVGYRVNSKRGIQFRRWASSILKDYLIQGYSINHDKVTQDTLNQLRQTIEVLSNTLINQNLVTDTGRGLLELIRSYAKTWDLLIKYDENNLDIPTNLQTSSSDLLSIEEARAAILVLKQELAEDAGNLFGVERDNILEGILGNIDQTWGGEALYKSAQEKAAHLLYFIIKDHPFSDGNKRIGSLLFLLYLNKAKLSLQHIDAASMTSLALLISESDPTKKELMIKLIINILS